VEYGWLFLLIPSLTRAIFSISWIITDIDSTSNINVDDGGSIDEVNDSDYFLDDSDGNVGGVGGDGGSGHDGN